MGRSRWRAISGALALLAAGSACGGGPEGPCPAGGRGVVHAGGEGVSAGRGAGAAGLACSADGEERPFPVVDLHVDLADAILTRGRTLRDPAGAASEARLRRGGVGLLVLPLFVAEAGALPVSEVRRGYEEAYAALRGAWQSSELLAAPGGRAPPGRVATVLAFEGADGLEGDPGAISGWIRRGACLFGLVHQRANRLAGSSQDPAGAGRAVGLTAAGRAVVESVYSSGGLVDVAHASDAAFDAVAALARGLGAPLVDSHTGVRALVDIERNLDDARLRAVGASGGVVGIDLHSGHVSPRPGEPATLGDVADHLEHAARVAGIEHVALGSDFEGGIVPPEGSDGEATWPALAALLRRRGWSDPQIEAVFAGNARRVLEATFARGCGRALDAPRRDEGAGQPR